MRLAPLSDLLIGVGAIVYSTCAAYAAQSPAQTLPPAVWVALIGGLATVYTGTVVGVTTFILGRLNTKVTEQTELTHEWEAVLQRQNALIAAQEQRIAAQEQRIGSQDERIERQDRRIETQERRVAELQQQVETAKVAAETWAAIACVDPARRPLCRPAAVPVAVPA